MDAEKLESEIIRMEKLTGETDDELMKILLEDAENYVLSYTNRTRMIPALYPPMRDLALIALNRMGTEGENSRSEGGESYSFDNAPKKIYDIMNRYRLARVGGKVHEAEEKQS